MKHLDLLLPFSMPPAELAGDLVRALTAPALATLTARAKSCEHVLFDGFSRALPHEAWLARQYGLARQLEAGGSPPVADAAMRALGITPDPGAWFILSPVHLHVARDHLVLTDQRQLALAGDASHALFDAVKPLFEELNRPLVYGDAHTWFTRADDWESLNTSTPDAACGHNIDIWMPQGAGEREWRKLQNEIQMQWHAHPVNETREARGLKPVNSVWLWGGTPPAIAGGPTRYPGLERLDGWRDALGRHAARQTVETTPSSIIGSPSAQGLAIETSLIEPALGGDWAIWLQRLHVLETDWFAPLLQALKAGKIDTLSLILTHGTQLSEFVSSKRSVGKFWVKPSLGKLVR